MKTLFKKSSIMLIAVSLVIAGGVSAALVSYISNAVTSTAEVSSPVDMTIYKGVKNGVTTGGLLIDLTPTHGGSTSESFTTTAKNNANNRIGGYYVMVIKATDNGDLMTGDEFTKMEYTINETGWTGEDGDIIALGKFCVVDTDEAGDLTLTKLANVSDWNKQKMILFYDYDSLDSEPDGNLEPCSAFINVYSPEETRSFTHLEVGQTRYRTFTPTWATTALGNFSISSQYVHDLATYATEQYGL